MYVMPCPHTWVFPFPRGQLERVEALHYQSQIEFFSCLLPSINVVQVKPGYRKEAPRCAWEVVCQITKNRELREGLAEHIHQIVESNKCINSESKPAETVPKEEIRDKNPYLKSLYEGLVMTEAQLQSVFKRHGLEQVNPLNEKFNPNFHEALFQQEVEGKEAGTVVVVSKVGYKLHDHDRVIIRPALVGVAK